MKQNEPFTTFVKLTQELDIQELERLKTDSPDWDTVANAVADAIMGSLIFMCTGETQKTVYSLVLMSQVVYLMGYKRGKAEKAMPVFLVGEE